MAGAPESRCNASLRAARLSACPSSAWQDRVAHHLVRYSALSAADRALLVAGERAPAGALVLVNVGANKVRRRGVAGARSER